MDTKTNDSVQVKEYSLIGDILPEVQKYFSPRRHEVLVDAKKIEIDFQTNKRLKLDQVLPFVLNEEGVLMAAGVIPDLENTPELNLFNAVFGRDSLVSSLMILDAKNTWDQTNKRKLKYSDEDFVELSNFWTKFDAKNIITQTVIYLASYQGVTFNPNQEQEVGKIAHEIRDPATDPIARDLQQQRGWEWPYFGSIDATFLWVSAVLRITEFEPDFLNTKIYNHLSASETSLGCSLQRALRYCLSLIDGDGALKYKRLNHHGIEIQSWRDSYDAVSAMDGELPDFEHKMELLDLSIVAIETLCLVIHKIQHIEKFDLGVIASDLEIIVEKMCNHIWTNYWIEEGVCKNYLAMGLQQTETKKVIFDAISSVNLTWLHSNLFTSNDTASRVNRLFKREQIVDTVYPLLCSNPYGISTLSLSSNRHHSSGYHTGNVWLFETAMGAISLAKIGRKDLAQSLAKKLIQVVDSLNHYPELIGCSGLNNWQIDVWDERDRKFNRVSQPAQPFQTWTIAAYLLMKCSLPIFEN